MIQSFRHRGLKRMYDRADPSGMAPVLVARAALALADLNDACHASDLDLPGYGFHPQKGDPGGHRSISISGNRRTAFRFKDGCAYEADRIDYQQQESETWR